MQLKALIQQTFDIFHVYGKPPEAVDNIVRGFWNVLEDVHVDDITSAFKQWMLQEKVIPTPSDILKITQDSARRRRARASGLGGQGWIQVVRNYDTDKIVAELHPREHLSPMDLEKTYGIVRVAMRRV